MMSLPVQKVHENAIIPDRANSNDAGLDLYAIENQTIPAGESALVRTGIKIALPGGTEGQIRPRSGLALKHQITVLNSPGTVDQGYRGEVGVILINHGKEVFTVEQGMKIAQLIVQPILMVQPIEVTELSLTDRGEKGFGSSGI